MMRKQLHENRIKQLHNERKLMKKRANRKINNQIGKYPLPNVEVRYSYLLFIILGQSNYHTDTHTCSRFQYPNVKSRLQMLSYQYIWTK